jgi:hypothetical protein
MVDPSHEMSPVAVNGVVTVPRTRIGHRRGLPRLPIALLLLALVAIGVVAARFDLDLSSDLSVLLRIVLSS